MPLIKKEKKKIILAIGTVTLQTAICTEIEAESDVDLVQLGEYNQNAPEKYWDQVYTRFGLNFSADPGIKYKCETGLSIKQKKKMCIAKINVCGSFATD